MRIIPWPCCAFLLLPARLPAQDAPPAAPERRAPGLMLTVESPSAGAGKAPATDARASRLAALCVPDGSPPSSLLPPGPFRATWEGDLTLTRRDEYAFSAEGRGTLVLTINGETAHEASGDDLSKQPGKTLRLNKGRNNLLARYESPSAGDARVRVLWTGEDFPPEPLPPDRLSHDAGHPLLVERTRLRQGRELFATGRCVKCHAWEEAPGPDAAPSRAEARSHGGMPDLDMDAPWLSDAGARLNAAWVARWIQNPRAMRPDASMPAIFGPPPAGPDGVDPRARDIAACLAAFDPNEESPEQPSPPETAAVGGRLYARLGCVGCHTLPDHADASTAGNRIPLKHVRAKWKPKGLREYLRKPAKTYAWTRMPDFKLSEQEAECLAAFLLSRTPAGPPSGAGPAGDPTRGRELFLSSGCLNCHPLRLQNAYRPPPSLKDLAEAALARGCLAPDDAARGRAPDFGWSEEQRRALTALLDTDLSSLARESPPEFAERQVKALRCAACHRRDGEDDAWTVLEGEAEALLADAPPEPPEVEAQHRVDQTRPSLTWIGEKLKPEWMVAFLAGEVPYKPRPWLRARMPAFPARAALLARGLALDHGCPPASPPEPAADPALAEVGRRFSGKNGGFGCASCHHIGSAAAVGVFEVMGVNFMRVTERMRKDYYHRWMRNPYRVEPGTKMPQFSNDAGRTAYKEVFEGDARKQFEAIWHYLLAGERIAAPEQ